MERKVTSVNLWAAVELSLTAKSLTSQRASSSRAEPVLGLYQTEVQRINS